MASSCSVLDQRFEQASIFAFLLFALAMLINTSFGVANIKKDGNIAKTLECSRFKTACPVMPPQHQRFTGMRISLSIAWLVTAAEMVVGGIGVGYYVWNEWNGLNLGNMIFAILAIGVVGLILDLGIGQLVKNFNYDE